MVKRLLLALFASLLVIQTVLCDNHHQPVKCDVIAQANSSVSVTCPQKSDNISWHKINHVGDQTTSLIIDNDKKYAIHADNHTLEIKKVGETENTAGDYTCGTTNSSETVTVCVQPYVKEYDKPKNVIEGDPFQSECAAWGYPAVTVTWFRIPKDGPEQAVTASDDVVLKDGSCVNSTVRVKSMKNEDAGLYICRVSNSAGSANATIMVHVKDKLAALWPFLGICAEVAILCIIIFFYERRRAQRLDKEAAASDEVERMNANNETKLAEEVRHRK